MQRTIVTSIDLEFNQPSGKIIQVGLCKGDLSTGEVLETKRIYVKIDEPLCRDENIIDIPKLTGITDERLAKDGVSLQEAYKQVVEFHKGTTIRNPVAWGIGDSDRLREQLEAEGVEFSPGFGVKPHLEQFCFGFRCFDCKQLYQEICLLNNKRIQNGLGGAMKRFKFYFNGRKHDAMDDAINTFTFYHYLLSRISFAGEFEMEFKEYSSIENSYRIKEVNIIQTEFMDKVFVVQEKIHGANFSFWIDADGVRMAKRSGFVEEDENFYNAKKLLQRYKDNLLDLYKQNYHNGEEVIIYGENYGGTYPHKDVPISMDRKVQANVYYHPEAQFRAFDMKVDGVYVNIDDMNEILDIYKIPRSEILLRGDINACLAYPNEFITKIPQQFCLPEIENNTCEGVVIKPVDPFYFSNGKRVILKNKNAKFSEANGEKVRVPKQIKPLSERVVSLMEEASAYVVEARLDNVLSKIGEVTSRDFGKMSGLLIQDVISDFRVDFPEFNELTNEERGDLTKFLMRIAGDVIKPKFLQLLKKD